MDEDEFQEVHKLFIEFSDIFSAGPHDLGCTDLIKHQINTDDIPPIRQPVRRLPLAKREEAERAVQEMREQDVIESSVSPWSSPIVLQTQQHYSQGFSYPLPRIDDTIEAPSGAKFFSTLDLKSGY